MYFVNFRTQKTELMLMLMKIAKADVSPKSTFCKYSAKQIETKFNFFSTQYIFINYNILNFDHLIMIMNFKLPYSYRKN
ncbi:hypothetical protein BpHYR1_007726 [Brachionus plicatilis]|uniref:Uncharacterized protein n=1 Tax=Brachionus plicatilis TaxID=10195 RepID=A0A3M7RHC4_BRAPC|nr:hypothetical protein BpHYR1_007726 [Brachionus plicatilis]